MNKEKVIAALKKVGIEINKDGYLVKANKVLPQFDRNKAGSLYDRGAADSYYHRPRKPHWYPNGAGWPPRIEDLTKEEIAEYLAGYEENERMDIKKEWED
jgi:hypothetical protein